MWGTGTPVLLAFSETVDGGRGSTVLGLKPLNTCVLHHLSPHSSRTRMSCGPPQQRRRPSTWMRPWPPAALVTLAVGETPGVAPTCSSRCTCTSTVWRSVAKEEVGARGGRWEGMSVGLPAPRGGALWASLPAWVGCGARCGCPDPSSYLYCFQCLEVAAACTSSTWAAVRRHSAEAGRLLEEPCVCLCQLWAVSSWPSSTGPSMCPTGEDGSGHQQGGLGNWLFGRLAFLGASVQGQQWVLELWVQGQERGHGESSPHSPASQAGGLHLARSST